MILSDQELADLVLHGSKLGSALALKLIKVVLWVNRNPLPVVFLLLALLL